MLLKSKVLETVKTFGEELELDDLLEKLVILNKFSIADRQISEGKIIEEEDTDQKINEFINI